MSDIFGGVLPRCVIFKRIHRLGIIFQSLVSGIAGLIILLSFIFMAHCVIFCGVLGYVRSCCIVFLGCVLARIHTLSLILGPICFRALIFITDIHSSLIGTLSLIFGLVFLSGVLRNRLIAIFGLIFCQVLFRVIFLVQGLIFERYRRVGDILALGVLRLILSSVRDCSIFARRPLLVSSLVFLLSVVFGRIFLIFLVSLSFDLLFWDVFD